MDATLNGQRQTRIRLWATRHETSECTWQRIIKEKSFCYSYLNGKGLLQSFMQLQCVVFQLCNSVTHHFQIPTPTSTPTKGHKKSSVIHKRTDRISPCLHQHRGTSQIQEFLLPGKELMQPSNQIPTTSNDLGQVSNHVHAFHWIHSPCN